VDEFFALNHGLQSITEQTPWLAVRKPRVTDASAIHGRYGRSGLPVAQQACEKEEKLKDFAPYPLTNHIPALCG
jgi:hypothetical protein